MQSAGDGNLNRGNIQHASGFETAEREEFRPQKCDVNGRDRQA